MRGQQQHRDHRPPRRSASTRATRRTACRYNVYRVAEIKAEMRGEQICIGTGSRGSRRFYALSSTLMSPVTHRCVLLLLLLFRDACVLVCGACRCWCLLVLRHHHPAFTSSPRPRPSLPVFVTWTSGGQRAPDVGSGISACGGNLERYAWNRNGQGTAGCLSESRAARCPTGMPLPDPCSGLAR